MLPGGVEGHPQRSHRGRMCVGWGSAKTGRVKSLLLNLTEQPLQSTNKHNFNLSVGVRSAFANWERKVARSNLFPGISRRPRPSLRFGRRLPVACPCLFLFSGVEWLARFRPDVGRS